MRSNPGKFSFLLIFCMLSGAALTPSILSAQGNVPKYEVDPSWPKLPLPNKWVTGGLGGMCVDKKKDHVFITNRQNVLDADLEQGVSAPPIIEFDPDGNVVNAWGDAKILGPRMHGCYVDKEDNIWIIGSGAGFIQKFSHDGSKLLLQIGKSGVFDSSDGTDKGKPLNSDLPQFFFPSMLDIDPQNGDIYVADGEGPGGNSRVAVFNREGQFLRQWRLHRTEGEKDIVPVLHCLKISNDGLVYICDRQAHRIQVFDKMGAFKKNITIEANPNTPSGKKRITNNDGAATVFDFSPDQGQRLLYVANQNTNQINIVDRQSGQVLSRFGSGAGRYLGQFITPHGIGVDSKGNVYVAEQEGRRIQKFKIVQR